MFKFDRLFLTDIMVGNVMEKKENIRKEKIRQRKKKINIFMKLILQIKGCCDAKDGAPFKSEIIEKYYNTNFIIVEITKFIDDIAENEFSKHEDRLVELNRLINILNDENNEKIQGAEKDIKEIKRKIVEIATNQDPNSPSTKARIVTLNDEIARIENVAIDEIKKNNSTGSKNESEAKSIIESYDHFFNDWLIYCLKKLTIYWGSLYIKNLKIQKIENLHGELPNGNNLLEMCERKNPKTRHEIIHYKVIPIDEIDNIKHRYK